MKEEKKETIKLCLDIIFTFGHYNNANDVAMALCKAGRYVNIKSDGITYSLYVYSRSN